MPRCLDGGDALTYARYCRFHFVSICFFSALMDNYYFDPNREMKMGHCSLIVKQTSAQHSGQWTCAGRLTGHDTEHSDDFRVHVFDEGMSVAAIGGMAFAALFIVGSVVVTGFVTYRKRYRSVPRTSTGSQSDLPIQLQSE